MNIHGKINYIEFPASDMEGTKAFFCEVFDWKFTDCGPDYTAATGDHVECGFFRSDMKAKTETGSALAIFYSQDLETTQAKVELAGGVIVRAVFSFPGGRRFQFSDPSGNEYAVWSDKNLEE